MVRRSCIRAAVTCSVAALLVAGPARGQTLDEQPASAAELGAAGARLVSLDAASALWVNAAELADVAAFVSLAASLQSTGRAVDHAAAASLVRDAGPPVLAPAAAFAHPLLGRRLALAAGYRLQRRIASHFPRPPQIAVASAVSAPDPLRYLGSELALFDHRFALGAALRLGALRLGVAAELGVVSFGLTRTLWAGFPGDTAPLAGAPETTSRHDVSAQLALSGLSYGVRLGAAWPLARWLRLGATVSLPGRALLSGEARLARPCDPSRADCQPAAYELQAHGGAAELELALPVQLAAGLDLAPTPWLHLFVAAVYRWLSAADQPTATLAGAAVSVTRREERSDHAIDALPLGIGLRDAGSVHVGLELSLADGFLVLRAGWALLRGATDPELPSPVALDLDRHRIAAGLQTRLERLTLALSLSWDLAAALHTAGERALLVVPLDGTRRVVVGEGRYEGDAARALIEVGVGW